MTRKRRSKGGIVTITVVVGLVAAMGLTVLGLGVADHAVANYDASSWLWSSPKSEMARVNGVTDHVDTRLQVPAAQGHTMQVSQTDRYLVLRDLNTGQVSSIDLATLQVSATTQTTAGLGVSVALHNDAAFIIDAVQGVVRQLDPHSLLPVGEPVRYPPGITGGMFDGDGRLWIAVPSEGTVSAVTPAPIPSGNAAGTGGSLSPKEVQTLAVAPPSHDLAISALDNGVAILDRTTSALTTVRGTDQHTIPLSMAGPGAMPDRTSGADVPVTVVDDRHIYVVNGVAVHDFVVPGDGAKLRPAVAWAGRLYVADDSTGTVYVLDANGKLTNTVAIKGANGPLGLEVREGHLFINAPNSSTARVVDDKNHVSIVDKYANNILGGDPPKDPPPPPPPPKKPVVGPPSAPRSVTATAGNATAQISWQPASANGATITKYVVEGDNKSYDVGADQRSLQVTGLTNGQSYQFTVYAVNSKGSGPKKASNPVVPSSQVPDAPVSVTAAENKDGTVKVSWPAANGQGHKVVKYAVTAVSAGVNAPIGESAKAELVIPAGSLQYGQQYAFTVVAVNELGTGSKASPVSNTVLPYTVPTAPQTLGASTVASQKGAIHVAWQPATENGRPITKYVVTAAGKSQDVTDTQVTLTGLADGANVPVKVHAVNAAGDGPDASATAKTVAVPTLTLTGGSSALGSITVNFSVNNGGGNASCKLAVNGGGSTTGGCTSLTVGVNRASTSYGFTVTVTNAASSASASGNRASSSLTGVERCVNNVNSSDPAQQTWCNSYGNSLELSSSTTLASQVSRATNGGTYTALCKKGGESVFAYVYNNQKDSTWWVLVKVGSAQYYTPWAWFNLANNDQVTDLPTC